MSNYALLLSPCFSKYDALENLIVEEYVKQAWMISDGAADGTKYNVLNIVSDSPYILFQNYVLGNSQRTRIQETSPMSINPATTQPLILTIALTAVLLDHLSNSKFLFVNGNGPVVNEGFSTFIGISACMSKPVVYWKDDARRLWASADNPLTVGVLPSTFNAMIEPFILVNRLTTYKQELGVCGDPTLPEVITEALKNTVPTANVLLSTKITNLIKLGDLINKLALSKGGWIQYQRDPIASYNGIKDLILANLNLLDAKDGQILQESHPPSPPPTSFQQTSPQPAVGLSGIGNFSNMQNIQGPITPEVMRIFASV